MTKTLFFFLCLELSHDSVVPVWILTILNLLLSLQNFWTQRHLHENVLGKGSLPSFVGVHAVFWEEIISRHIGIEPQHLEAVDYMVIGDPSRICNLIVHLLKVQSLIERAIAESTEVRIVNVGTSAKLSSMGEIFCSWWHKKHHDRLCWQILQRLDKWS